MGDYGAVLEEVRRLRWRSLRPVRGDAALPGMHHSMRRGTAVEFAEYRPYRQGDPLQRVDWKLFARTDRAYLRLSTERTILPTMLVLDASASMDFPEGSGNKLEHARQVVVALAAVAWHEGDPVGAAIATDRPVLYQPRARGGAVYEIARLLDAARPGRDSDLAAAVAAAARLARRVAIVSDFLADEEALLAIARMHRARGGEMNAVHLVAEAELEPTVLGAVHDPESPLDRRSLHREAVQEYTRSFAAWREQLATSWRATGARYTLVRTDGSASEAVRRVVGPG